MSGYVNIPNAPGVPPVLRDPTVAVKDVVLLTADAAIIASQFTQGASWGIFDTTGQPVITATSVLAVDVRREWRVSDYPVEQGAFASYDKVSTPTDIRVTFSATGETGFLASVLSGGVFGQLLNGDQPLVNRKAFLAAMDAAANALDLYQVITPEATYLNCNIVHYDYRREARSGGASMLKVDVWLREIRQAAAAQYTNNTKNPAAADPVDGGTVQPTTPTAAQSMTAPSQFA